ncbi:MAG: glycoside hydrolase family 13 protein [Clostridia bacterium]|nr:glycoside hydrolase family 13 protein [Clostridia bacterium]
MDQLFNSRNPYYRSPTGAVEEGTQIHFRIKVPLSLKCSKAHLIVINENNNSKRDNYTMLWDGMTDDCEIWECDFIPKKFGLYWYSFQLDTPDGLRFLVRDFGSVARIDYNIIYSWQLTCYKKGFKTPDWPAGGVMYQIFPDRFYFSGENKRAGRKDREYHENWSDTPEWRPNSSGIITNTDFFEGDLKGITQKLDYLEELGVTCIYLNPIFEAYSNHRYDTASYEDIDPLLGNEDDFKTLCAEAKKRGIRVINDGVFSHTGSDSKYFNRQNRYNTVGAFNSKESPYFSWYDFNNWPHGYNSWWGFDTLPNTREDDPGFNEYINGENGIIRKWIKAGNSGWRLDVADELPDVFIKNLRKAVKAEDEDAIVIGEVWEDASNKESYGSRRKFILGEQLDTVMNYPFRSAILEYLHGVDAFHIMEGILCIMENYPRPVIKNLMNFVTTHDTERTITVLAGEPLNNRSREFQANTKLTPEQRTYGIKAMKIAAGMQFTLPGFPCVYYGDEAGVEGYKDPFNRSTYPWGNEDKDLLEWHKSLAKFRKSFSCFNDGEFRDLFCKERVMSYERYDENSRIFCIFNAGDTTADIPLPRGYEVCGIELTTSDKAVITENGTVEAPALSCVFVKAEAKTRETNEEEPIVTL